MSTFGVEDYELYWSLANTSRPPLLEAWAGTDVVGWQGTIERQLNNRVSEYEQAKNNDYATKLREYLRIWRDNPFTGSVNIETVNTLLSAADVLAVDGWKLNNYFSELRDNLRKLKAAAEQLPPIPTEGPKPRNSPRMVSQSTPTPPSTEFGPQREAPTELEPGAEPEGGEGEEEEEPAASAEELAGES